ncbi:hypothetical protein TELCIR_24877 [Teladorsagia circumcincta]|uniref:Uncharacterized protein n=1 Tax=Teladorsagia circumcincta TaxID=45464 RepID=A0A2G9T751_TELCI|nr:hypothetical protein TELCIR_24877 [Teladorsagia circumcincta]
MPTTCGFPNCKFRSRYRGQEDNRHFYRIPKRPQVLRQRWLLAIGRTEETVVSQLHNFTLCFPGKVSPYKVRYQGLTKSQAKLSTM